MILAKHFKESSKFEYNQDITFVIYSYFVTFYRYETNADILRFKRKNLQVLNFL